MSNWCMLPMKGMPRGPGGQRDLRCMARRKMMRMGKDERRRSMAAIFGYSWWQVRFACVVAM